MSNSNFDFASISEMELEFWGQEAYDAQDALDEMIDGQVALESAYDAGEMMNAWNQAY
jgi:hypothetical protein